MDRFIEFNPVKFLQESKTWKSKIAELKKELESITDINGVDNDGMPRGTDVGDPTGQKAIRSQQIECQIIKLEYYIETLSCIMKNLSQEEVDVINIFFFEKGYIPPKIAWYGQKYALCRSDVYKARRMALEHISRIAVERI